MAANKRPPAKGPERPMLRTSHGAPGTRGGGKAGETTERRAKPKPARAPRAAARATTDRAGAAERERPAPSRRGIREREPPSADRDDRGAQRSASAVAEDDGSRLKKTGKGAVPGATSTASDESREVAILIATAGIEKKASGLEVIDVAGRVDYADFLVLMSGRSDRHVTALASSIEEALRKRNKRALAVEGLPHANWVLMDFGDVVVHVFQDDARSAYDIDSLWMDARRVPVPLGEEPG